MSDPSSISQQDIEYLSNVHSTGTDGSLMIQAYKPGIANGEYSLIYVTDYFTFAIRKVSSKCEFRCQPEFGGRTIDMSLNEVPSAAKKVAEQVVQYIQTTVGQLTYCRVGGVIRDAGEFVLMEVEAIEPDLYMEVSSNAIAKEILYTTLTTPRT